MLAPEDQIRPKPIPSLPIPPVNVEEELLPLIVHPQRLPNERDCEWDALQVQAIKSILHKDKSNGCISGLYHSATLSE